MSILAKLGWAAVLLFTFANLFGVVYAAVMGEVLHGAIHAVLLAATAAIVWKLAARSRARRVASY